MNCRTAAPSLRTVPSSRTKQGTLPLGLILQQSAPLEVLCSLISTCSQSMLKPAAYAAVNEAAPHDVEVQYSFGCNWQREKSCVQRNLEVCGWMTVGMLSETYHFREVFYCDSTVKSTELQVVNFSEVNSVKMNFKFNSLTAEQGSFVREWRESTTLH